MVDKDDRAALDDLDKRLQEAETTHRPPRVLDQPPGSAVGLAARMGVELVVGLVVGGMIGWGFDRLFGTEPWAMLVFFLLGIAAGMRNVMRTASAMNARQGSDTDPPVTNKDQAPRS
jgi:ATP synthase protein I